MVLIDIYIKLLFNLMLGGIMILIGYALGRASVWSEINRNGGITKEDGEEADDDAWEEE